MSLEGTQNRIGLLGPIVARGVRIELPFLQAPMEGVSDRVFRRVIRKKGGCGLTCTEFVPAKGLPHAGVRLREALALDPDERPVAVQLFGKDPETMAIGAEHAVALAGADVIDLNMGCPAKRVVAHSGGASLMREPALVAEIVRAVRARLTGPLSVKMRAGWDDDSLNAPEIAHICQEEGADWVSVHWRTREQGYGGVRRWDVVRAVVERVAIPVVANGDILDVRDAEEAARETGARALMVGRGAVQDPWIFAALAAWWQGLPWVAPTAAMRMEQLLSYLHDYREDSDNPRHAIGRFKQVAKLNLRAIPGSEEVRGAVLRATRLDEVEALLRNARLAHIEHE